MPRELSHKPLTEAVDRFFELAPNPLAIAGFDGCLKRVNPAFTRTFGYTAGELLERSFIEFVHPEEQSATLASVERIKAGVVATENFESRFRARNGSYYWLRWIAESNGDDGFIYAVTLSSTSQKRNETLVRGQKEALELIVRGMPLGSVLDAVCRFIESEADDMLCSVLLLDQDGLHLLHGAAPSLPVSYMEAIDGITIGPSAGSCGTAAFRREPVIVSDILIDPLWEDFRELARTHDLHACWSMPIFGSNSQVLGTLATYHREPRSPSPGDRELMDIAAHLGGIAIGRQRIEEEREQLLAREQAALAEAEIQRHRLHELFMQAPVIVCVLRGPQHRLELINPPFRQIFGNREFTPGKTARELWFDLEGQGLLEVLDSVYQTGEPFLANEFYARIDRNHDGELEDGYFTFRYQPSRDANGEIDGVLVCGYEVTDQVLARQQAEDAVRARDEFLSIASHELRNPIATVKGYAQLLRRTSDRGRLDSEQIALQTRTIDEASGRLAVLVDDLLDVSRLRSGQFPLRPQPMDLAALVSEIAGREQFAIDGRHPRVTGAAESCSVVADPDRIQQILVNLIDNAVKYSPDGGQIDVMLSWDERQVLVQVRDQGIGLPEGAVERIFEPFGRAANAAVRNLPGMGLGLYICRQIAEAHAGRLWAESAGDGHGTTMFLKLPADMPADVERAHG